MRGVQTLDLQPECISRAVQTKGTAGWPTTPTLAVVSAQTTRSPSQFSLQNAEISAPRPLRPTP
jgi:hypothetical protein